MIAFFLGQASVAFWPVMPAWMLWPWGPLGIGLTGLLCGYAWTRIGLPSSRAKLSYGMGLCGLICGLGAASWWQQHQLPSHWQGVDLQAQGTVIGLVQHQGGRCRFDFQLARIQHPGEQRQHAITPRRLRLSWYNCSTTPTAGERWALTVRLKRLHGYSNPAGFDYPLYLIGRGIDATGYVRDADARRLGQAAWLGRVDRLRQRLVDQILAVPLPEPAPALLSALLLGDRRGLDDPAWALLRETGTAHLVVVSGLHIGMLAAVGFGFITFIGRWFPHYPYQSRRTWAALTAIILSGVYAMLAGFTLPTQRAWVMVCAWMLSLIWLRQIGPWHRLLLAAVVVQLLEPLALRQSSFWLSFGACAVLIWLGYGRLRPLPWWRQALQAQWAVSIGLLPWLLFYFQQGALQAPLINLVAVPLVMLLLPLALAGLLLAWLWPTAPGLLQLCGWLLELGWYGLSEARQWLAPWPLAGPISVWVVALALVGSALLLQPLNRIRWLGLVCWLPLLFPPADQPEPGALKITMIDVGQGLSMLLQTHQHRLLYDTGPRYRSGFSAAEAAIIPYLYSRGIRQLDRLIISHQDSDHAGGQALIKQRLQIGQTWSGEPRDPGESPCRAGSSWYWDGVEFEVLYPFVETVLDQQVSNNRSCVLRVSTPAVQILLTGDIDHQVEQQLIERYADRLRSSELLIAHHGSGSSTSSAFIQAVNPQRGWISSGWRNRFGHPHPQVIERLSAAGVELFNTAEDGAVTLQLGADGEVRLERNRQANWRYWESN
ncbi:DNA internalization-related competence protein ComEC/Rec2 [Motiliproteus coralliicola]|uniref:DNA internalization-related competence protein ComEC/Rec2 n=1 Tax=Motiliproteus coralliicola TaxID=2283196 RepID=A0A369WRG9_9GAMM|nr:DNA internalization-related competence protein ComEC/Rec2 [Motiliproteus coralliicola]RDE24282.1 DNA internalization-related competence protein ComEC/Rec2 [Motiliproteus coralliicola]